MREREQFLAAITERSNRSVGADDRVLRNTVAQRSNEEAVVTRVMRGNINWGTPVVEPRS